MNYPTASKEGIRKSALEQRDRLSEYDRSAASEIIEKTVLSLFAEWDVRRIHCYLNFRSEVQTDKLVDGLLRANVEVFSPAMVTHGATEVMEHVRLTSLPNLNKGQFGIPEPIGERLETIERLDAVILPLAAFDRSGARVGYGKGFYDRFLADLPRKVKRVGLAYRIQEFSEIPTESHDIPLDVVVTEKEIIFSRESE